MKPKRITKDCIDKNLGLPTVFVRLHGEAAFGFSFLIDTGVRHNLLDLCFFEQWINFAPIPAIENSECALEHYPVFPPPFEQLGTKRVLCKDGIRRACSMIKLNFTIEDKGGLEEYSELFAIDPSMCHYFNSKRGKAIAGVLGNDSLKRHGWVLEYATM